MAELVTNDVENEDAWDINVCGEEGLVPGAFCAKNFCARADNLRRTLVAYDLPPRASSCVALTRARDWASKRAQGNTS